MSGLDARECRAAFPCEGSGESMRRTGRHQSRRARAPLALRRLAVAALTVTSAALPMRAAAQPAADPHIGLHTTFTELIERRQAREQGRRITLGLNPNARSPFLRDNDPRYAADVVFSPWTDTVYEIGGPGWRAMPLEYYVVDGAFLTYDPADFNDPSVHVRAVPRAEYQSQRIAAARSALYDGRQKSSFATEKKGLFTPGSGLTVNVPIHMPGPLSEFFGRGATNIKVTGRENISFAGESRVISPFIESERGRGQSLFPRLDMKQELQVKLDGTIGDKVHVQVDHNSSGFGADANRINIYYEGYDDDILRRVDLGGTNLSLPGSSLVSFSGGHRGLFGVKSIMRFSGLDFTMIASKEEADVETRTLNPSGGAARPSIIAENAFARDRFFFMEHPDTTGTTNEFSYGIPIDSLFDESLSQNIRVFIDTQDLNTLQRPYKGFAVADLSTKNEAAMVAAYTAAGPTGRFPENPPREGNGNPGDNGFWKAVDPDDIGFVKLESSDETGRTRKRLLGFYFRTGSLDPRVAVGVVVEGTASRWGSVDIANNVLRMRLIRHPSQDANFANYPSAAYMMRHVYVLGSQGITNLDLRIAAEDPGRVPPEIPQNLRTSTYLHMFGVDEFDEQNQRRPDGKFDIQDRNRLNTEEGFLFLPGIRPFSPPEATLRDRLLSAGVSPDSAANFLDTIFPLSERVDRTLYTLPANDQFLPRATYRIEATTTGTETEITLPQDIIENSEVVKLDGQILVRGQDYDIDPVAGGRITLKGDALARMTPGSKIDVTYQFRPLFGGGKSSLWGMSGEYPLGARGRLAAVFLYESTGGFTRRPKLGEEPTRSVVADVNGSLRFQPRWMTRLINVLPFTNSNAPSAVTLTGEVAVSAPNPNTRKIAFVDDLEGADDSDEQNLSRTNWAWASIPYDDPVRRDRGGIGPISRPDTLLRVPISFYNPPSERVRRGYLNPKLSENEIRDGLTVLELGFDRQKFAELDTVMAAVGRRDFLWSGIMRSFGAAPLDLTRTKSFEFWLNDGQPNPIDRKGKLHIDLGRMSENFVFFPESRFGGDPEWNREAASPDQFQVQSDDFGWDHVNAGCPKDKELAELLPFNADCYVPSAENPSRQFFLANGTAGNLQYDTEDLNGNQQFEDTDSYFGVTLDLSDSLYVVTDVSQEFGDDADVPADILREIRRQGWRKYRIDFALIDSLQVHRSPGEALPDLRRISYMRLWFEDTPGTAAAQSVFNQNIQLYGLRLTRNQWIGAGFHAVDSVAVAPAPNENFTIGVINNKDDPLNYVIPPATTDIDDQGVQARQQSLRLAVDNLQSGHEALAERSLAGAGQSLDFTLYRRLSYFVHSPVPAAGSIGADSLEFFFRVGTDTLNYYEIASQPKSYPPRLPKEGWREINVDLDQLTGLKFPEDYRGAVVETLQVGTQRVLQTTAEIVDAKFRDIPLRVTLRGAPSLQRVLRLFVGLRNRGTGELIRGYVPGGPNASGEVWFDNVRLDEVERERGFAQTINAGTKFADVLDVSGAYQKRDSEFRSLRQRVGTNLDSESWNGRASISDLSRVVPLLGFSLPVGYSYSWDRSLPKYFNQSDTRNTLERKIQQRNEAVRTSYNFAVSKRPSQFWLNKVTLDRLAFSFSQSREERRTFVSRDTSATRQQSVTYDLSPRERTIRLGNRTRLSYLPTNIKFAVQSGAGTAFGYNVLQVAGRDSLVRRPSSVQRSMNVSASTALKPLPILNVRYTYQEPRSFRRAHPLNEIERVKFLGIDFGLPGGSRNEALSVDFTPRRMRIGANVNFGDSRTQQSSPLDPARPLPDVHNASSNRSARVSFDFGFHRRVFGWIAPGRRGTGRQTPPADGRQPQQRPDDLQEPPAFDDERPPLDAPADSTAGRGREDLVPQSMPPDPELGTPEGYPPPVPRTAADSSFAPAERVGEIAVPPDSLKRTKRKAPSPVDVVRALVGGTLRALAGIEPVKVEYAIGQNLSYTGLPDAPYGPFRYGLRTNSGLVGSVRFVTPPLDDHRTGIELSSAVPLRGALRMAVRFKRDETVRRARTFATVSSVERLTNTNEDHRVETTFPNLDLTINSIEKAPIFRKKLDRSSIQLQFQHSSSENFRFDAAPNGPRIEGSGRSQSVRTTATANWTGQWKHGVSSTLNVNQTNANQSASGTLSEGTSRQIQASVRFRLAPAGGLKLPFMRGGGLKSGMDVTLNSGVTTENRLRTNTGTKPVTEANTLALTLGARGDYMLSRSMNGGVELGFTRQSRNDIQKQTASTVRLGFNLTFLF